jgi:hypothetical protein
MAVMSFSVPQLEDVGPVLQVDLGNSLTGQQALRRQLQPVPGAISVRALVDTGADMSVIADGLARQLQLTFIGFQFLAGGLAGSPLPGVNLAPEYSARVEWPNGPGFDLTVLEIALPGGLQLLIGRDLLAKGVLIYDGLSEVFTLAF